MEAKSIQEKDPQLQNIASAETSPTIAEQESAENNEEDIEEEEIEEEPLYDPTKPIQHINVEYCEKCNIPTCYCPYFGHVIAKPKIVKTKVVNINSDGEEVIEEEEVEEEEEEEVIEKPKPKGKKGQILDIVITVKSRTKRKNTTTIANLASWDIDVKEFSKSVQKKMAIGCSYKKSQMGLQVVIQGDVGQAIAEILIKQYNIPKANIQAIRKTKKKPTNVNRHQPPPQPMLGQIEELSKSTSTKQPSKSSAPAKATPNKNRNRNQQKKN
ncbi:Translation initiation factor SUI1 [Histomonas meleagridis]|uniref:Translation initiation factor SUI1 n=1 Tax=Histomonas meleagridis TaxID=135588 RepID=UPI00355A225E|nr:Translation initiation factor SUI1 [Histomonas meleagridis]KAH0806283.1 Translation initiation factor SUI1 [Histomonas meleagridis]